MNGRFSSSIVVGKEMGTENDREDYNVKEERMTPDQAMKQGLFAASRVPAREAEIRSFQTLHSPKIHGMAAWLLQYESACRRQNKYLQQIQDLRQQFRTSADEYSGATGSSSTWAGVKSKTHTGSFWRHVEPFKTSDPRGYHQVCVLHPRQRRKTKGLKKGFYRHGDVVVPSTTNNFLMAPRSLNISPGEQSEDSSHQVGSLQKVQTKLPPIGGLDRNPTDYEPIEFIAKRNKLDLNHYLPSSKPRRSSPKKVMDVSDVYVQSTKIV